MQHVDKFLPYLLSLIINYHILTQKLNSFGFTAVDVKKAYCKIKHVNFDTLTIAFEQYYDRCCVHVAYLILSATAFPFY